MENKLLNLIVILLSVGILTGAAPKQETEESPLLSADAQSAFEKFRSVQLSLREAKQELCPHSERPGPGNPGGPDVDESSLDESQIETREKQQETAVQCISEHFEAWFRLDLRQMKIRQACMIPPPRPGIQDQGRGSALRGFPPPPRGQPDFSRFSPVQRQILERKLTSKRCQESLNESQ